MLLSNERGKILDANISINVHKRQQKEKMKLEKLRKWEMLETKEQTRLNIAHPDAAAVLCS